MLDALLSPNAQHIPWLLLAQCLVKPADEDVQAVGEDPLWQVLQSASLMFKLPWDCAHRFKELQWHG